jgi:hypothetical protein
MPGAASSILLLIEFLCGAAGGIALGRWARSYSFGVTVDGLIGGIGGLLLVWPASGIPGIGRFIGQVENAADAAMRGIGGLTPAILIGTGITGLLGGLVLIVLAGFVRTMVRA